MDSIFEDLLKSEQFNDLYSFFLKAVDLYKMHEMIRKGVLIGLSGGADSVMLLLLILKYRKDNADFNVFALHVNHGIRGAEADRDEEFSLKLAERLCVDAASVKINCPDIRAKQGGGLEEIARNARYNEFQKIINGRNDISYIAVAHNADDNIETMLFNLMRGTGTAGMAGIPPIRENIIRPMILLKKQDIIKVLDDFNISYMTDSTNFDSNYSRNYIRTKILPSMLEFSDNIHQLAARASYNLRTDNSFIDSVADNFLIKFKYDDQIPCDDIFALHPAVLSRVIKGMAKAQGCSTVEFTHISKIASLLKTGNFSYSLPDNFVFISEYGKCRVEKKTLKSRDFHIFLEEENTEISEFSACVVISDKKSHKISSNVYNFSIQADLSSAIINNGIFVRNKKEGDVYRYDNMSHKLKKLFSDVKIPKSLRDRVPVFCDDSGVLWIPGFGVRDDGNISGEKKYITLFLKSYDDENSFFIPRKKNLKQINSEQTPNT